LQLTFAGRLCAERDRGSNFCIIHTSERRAASSGVNDGVVADNPVRPHTSSFNATLIEEMAMKVLTMLVLASVLGMSSAVARADVPVVNKTPTAKAQAVTTDGAPVKVSQQDKMRLCAKQASGKKGAERKAFMKTCLSAKKA
jgi:psiF repeat